MSSTFGTMAAGLLLGSWVCSTRSNLYGHLPCGKMLEVLGIRLGVMSLSIDI